MQGQKIDDPVMMKGQDVKSGMSGQQGMGMGMGQKG